MKKSSLRPNFSIFLFLAVVVSCISKNEPDVLTTSRVARLLALDTGKIWLRTSLRSNGEDVELADCQLQNRYSFTFIENADTAFYIGSPESCTAVSSDTLNRLSWEIVGNIRNEFQDSIKLSDESGEEFTRKVSELTSNNLIWEFTNGTNKVRETFIWDKTPN